MKDSPTLKTKRAECVFLAIAGHDLPTIAKRIGVTRERVRQMIVQQAGCDFYEQLRLERGHRRGMFDFMKRSYK